MRLPWPNDCHGRIWQGAFCKLFTRQMVTIELIIWQIFSSPRHFQPIENIIGKVALIVPPCGVRLMVCASCESYRMRRIKREGFLRERLAPLFGYFPWRCSNCGAIQMLRSRGEQRHSRDAANQLTEASRASTGQLRSRSTGAE